MENSVPLVAASTQRQIGYAIAGIVLIAMAVYWLFNWLEGRKETGAEIELAANRKPNLTDEEMETTRLDLSLTGGLVTLTIIAIALPLYWLGEPGRHEGLVDFTDSQSVAQGADLYEANCSQCHGSANGDGGNAADFTLVDSNGVYVQQVDWVAPSLGAVLDRFSYDEVKYILNYGRPNSPMPAWGGPGGGPMTDQQIDKVIAYLAAEQKTPDEIAQGVLAGLDDAALYKAREEDAESYAEQLQLERWIHDLEENHDLFDTPAYADIAARFSDAEAALAGLEDEKTVIAEQLAEQAAAYITQADNGNGDVVLYGELLFNNPAAGGAYGCARCHSAGFSYDANAYPENPLLEPIVAGGGGFGPSLVGVTDQFETADEQAAFIAIGSRNGQPYGAFGQGDGGGQMPGFQQCSAEENDILPRIQSDRIAGHCSGTSQTALDANDGVVIPRDGTLTAEQIMAIVEYERSLDS